MDLAVYDCVGVSLEKFGWSDKVFRLLSWEFNEAGAIELGLQEEDPSSYDWDAGTAELTLRDEHGVTLAEAVVTLD